MLTASSIRYGGMLVNAAECNYTSFKHLGLLCPICKRSVFLVGEKIRPASTRKNRDGSISAVKEANVCSYFSHHSDVDRDTINDCELRSSQITQAHRVAAETVSRNQRQKIMQAHLWKIISTSTIINDTGYFNAEFKDIWNLCYFNSSNRRRISLNQLIKYTIIYFRGISISDLDVVLKHDIERYKEGAIPTTYVLQDGVLIIDEDLDEEDKQTIALAKKQNIDLTSSIDVKMHNKVICEVLEFLKQKRQSPVFEKLVLLAIQSSIARKALAIIDKNKEDCLSFSYIHRCITEKVIEMTDDEEIHRFVISVIVRFLSTLIHVNWAYQFEALENKELVYSYQGKGFENK